MVNTLFTSQIATAAAKAVEVATREVTAAICAALAAADTAARQASDAAFVDTLEAIDNAKRDKKRRRVESALWDSAILDFAERLAGEFATEDDKAAAKKADERYEQAKSEESAMAGLNPCHAAHAASEAAWKTAWEANMATINAAWAAAEIAWKAAKTTWSGANS